MKRKKIIMFHQANNNFERRARLACLVLFFFPNMMRDFLLHCMNTKRLFQIYCNDHRNPSILTLTELNLITELPSVANFTIQLCYKFISYEELLPEPSNGWGQFPNEKALALADDIERIRHVVNEIIAVKSGECTHDYFVKSLYKIELIIKRIEVALGMTNVIIAYKTVLTQIIDTAEVLYEFENVCYIPASDIQHIKLQDRERFSKISIAVTDILPEILRNIMLSGITPTTMYMFCHNSTNKWTPSEISQINTLNFSDSYKSLDASLLYKLLRMFQFVQNPSQGWGKNPTKYDLSISDDIERIRNLRNKAAHSSNTRIDQGDFNDYFLQFHEIAQRRSMDVDKKLTEIETTSLDPQIQIDKERDLKELEDIKERFEKFPVKYFWGSKFESKIKEIRQNQKGNEKIPIVVKLPVLDEAETRARILNEFKEEINKDRLSIEFLEAVTGSLMIYADMYTKIMKTDENLQLELTSFMTRILHQGRYEIRCTQWVEAVIFLVEGNIELKIDSAVEKSLSLHLNVNMDVFETEARMESEIGAFMERTIGKLNGKGFNDTVTAIIDIDQSEDTIPANTIVPYSLSGPENMLSDRESAMDMSSTLTSLRHRTEHVDPYFAEDTIPANTIVPYSLAGPENMLSDRESAMDMSSTLTSLRHRPEHVDPYFADMALSTLAKDQENFLRYAILIVDHSKTALTDLVELNLKNKHLTFEDFLNQNQHEIYHLCYDSRCCQCKSSPTKQKRVIYPSQLELLYDRGKKLPSHRNYAHNDYCCSYAKVGITPQVLDLSLARCLLVNCCLDVFWFTCLTLQGQTLEQFLNSNKHIIYHLWKNNQPCCQCAPGFILPCASSIITVNEWRGMFSSVLLPCINDRKRMANGTSSVCSVAASAGIDVKDIRPDIQGLILMWCCSVRSSVEKLVECRNMIFGHTTNVKLSEINYNDFSKETEECIIDIARVCEKELDVKDAINHLRSIPINARLCPYYQNILLENINRNETSSQNVVSEHRKTRQKESRKLRKLEDIIESLEKSFLEIKAEVGGLRKLITDCPKRSQLIRETIAEIDNHRKDQTYTEIKAVTACVQLLDNNRVLILSGREGSGKSRNSLEILRQLNEKHPEVNVIKLKKLTQFTDIRIPIENDTKTIILFDDVFGRIKKQLCEDIDVELLDNLNHYISSGNVKVIFVMRNTVKHECESVLSTHEIFCNNIAYIDLNSKEFGLSLMEKERIFINYCTKNEIDIIYKEESSCRDALDIKIDKIQVSIIDKPDVSCHHSTDKKHIIFNSRSVEDMIRSDPYQGYPQYCRLFTQYTHLTILGTPFFKYPLKSLLQEIENMRIEGIENDVKGLKYVILVYILLNQPKSAMPIDDISMHSILSIKPNRVMQSTNENNIDVQAHQNLFNECYNRHLKLKLKHIIDLYEELICRYLNRKEKKIHFQHSALQDSVLISYCKTNPKAIIPLLSFDHMVDIVRPQNYMEQKDEIVMKIPKPYYPELARKIISLIDCRYNDQSKLDRFMESKIIAENDEDLIYQLIVCIQNGNETFSSPLSSDVRSYIYHYFPLYLLRSLGKFDEQRFCVDHTKGQMLISVVIGDQNTTFCVDPFKSLTNALQSKYKDIVQWLLENTKHSLIDFTYVLYNHKILQNLQNIKLLLDNVKHDMFDMNQLFLDVCFKCYNGEKHAAAVDLIVDNVDNSLIDFNECIEEMIDMVDTDIILHILKKVDHRCLKINAVVKSFCKHGCSEIVEWILKNVDHELLNEEELLNITIDGNKTVEKYDGFTSYGYGKIVEMLILRQPQIICRNINQLSHIANRKKWYGVLELLFKHDSNLSINKDKIITDAYKRFYNVEDEYEEDEDEEDEDEEDEFDEDDNDFAHCMKIVQLIMEYYLDIDVNKIIKKTVETGLVDVLEKMLLDKVDNIPYYIDVTLQILRRQQHEQLNDDFSRFGVDHGKILMLLLQRVNNKSIDLKMIMNEVCDIGHSLSIQWLLENKPDYHFDVRNIMNKACFHGDLELMEYIFQNYTSVDIDYKSAMMKACRNPKALDVCEWLWRNIDNSMFDMKTALNNASRYNNTEVVEWILTEIDNRLFDTEDALFNACKHSTYHTVKLLLDASSMNMIDIQSAIIIACQNDNSLCITRLLYEHADQSTIDINAVCSAACKNYKSDIIQWIIEMCYQNQTVTEARDENKHLIKGLDKNRLDMDQVVTCILDMDAPWQEKDHVIETRIQLLMLILTKSDPRKIHIYQLLTESCKNDWVEIFQWILGRVDNDCLNIGEIINVACRHGAFNIIEWSLENIDMHLIDVDNVMIESCGFGWLECLVLILKHCNRNKLQAAMTEACTYGRLHIAEWLLQNVHYQLLNIPMLLHEAGRNGWIKIFGWILQNFHLEESDMHIAIGQALENGHLNIAELVISKFGKTSFDFSSLSKDAYVGANNEGVVNFLLHNCDHRSIDIATIMTNACLFGWKDVATFIVDNNLTCLCDLSLGFNTACDNGELEIVQLLLDKVDPHILTTVDKAMHAVAVKGWDEIAVLLLEKVEHSRLDVGNALIEACRHGEIDVVQAILRKVDNNMLDVKAALDKACENHMHEELVLWIFENIDQEEVDLKTVKKQAIQHKWWKVQLALTKVDTEILNAFEQETETDNIIFLE